ncbi:MAG: T9SS type A sorting domain-containing protein, partial [Candidatus Peribacteria bacterium]|nr:T9SS type A sorting domain-containing protein [Candidatus Peribacteria bacterium]
PATNYVIDEVRVDGDLVDSAGSYTFDNVTANHTIHVTFKYYNSVDEVDPNAVNIYYYSGIIYLKNLQPGTTVQIVDVLGRVVYQTIPTGESISFSERGVYVVRLLHKNLQQAKKIMVY